MRTEQEAESDMGTEQPRYRKMPIPHDEAEQRRLLCSLMNVRLPQQLSDDFLAMQDEELLASCYRSCLELAELHDIQSIAFCCISTGEFHFPNDRAAEIAVQTVTQYKEQTHSEMKVIFNVFKDVDDQIYRNLLAAD